MRFRLTWFVSSTDSHGTVIISVMTVSRNHGNMRFFIDHKRLDLPRCDLNHLESLLRLTDWWVAVQNVSFFSTVESYSRLFKAEPFDDSIARHFIDSSLATRLLQELNSGGKLINKFTLALIATTALRLGAEKKGNGKFTQREIIGELLLTANDIGTQDSEGNPRSPNSLAALVRQVGVSSGENPFSRIARYYQLLVEIPQALPHNSGWRDIANLFYKGMGFDVDRLFSLGFGIYAYYFTLGNNLNQRWKSAVSPSFPNPDDWKLDSRTFLKNSQMSAEEAHQLMLRFSTNPANYRSDTRKTCSAFDFTHIKTRPMIHLGGTQFCVPVLDFLFDRVTVRAYFDITDSLQTKEEKQTFGGFCGHVVEKYVHMLLKEMLGESGGLPARWFKPEDYVRPKNSAEGPDAIIIDHDKDSLVAIFLEVKSYRPNKDVFIYGDLNNLRKNWNDFLIGSENKPLAARQLDKAVTNFRKGNLSIPGIESSQIATIYPIIVTLDPWPFYLDIYDEFSKDITGNNLLSGQGVAPIDIWSCFDLELLSPRILAGSSLMDIIKRRQKVANRLPLSLQISRGAGTSSSFSPLLSKTWEQMHKRMIVDLGLNA